jgi:hypothetical protein
VVKIRWTRLYFQIKKRKEIMNESESEKEPKTAFGCGTEFSFISFLPKTKSHTITAASLTWTAFNVLAKRVRGPTLEVKSRKG